jgi:hypothetical protein
MIPVAARQPGNEHHLAIAIDGRAGAVRWLINNREVYRVDRVGYRLPPREHMTLDHGGIEVQVFPRQIACGMGMFTILDSSLPTGNALVRLSSAADYYYNPVAGPPALETFVDVLSLEQSRIFGQGADMHVRHYVIANQPIPR